MSNEEGKVIKKKNKKFIVWVVISGVLAVLTLIYGGIAVYYQSHFLPNTKINHISCDNLTADIVTRMVEQQIDKYTLEVTGRDFLAKDTAEADRTEDPGEEIPETLLGTINAQDIQLSFVGAAQEVQHILETQNSLLWMKSYFGSENNISIELEQKFDEALLEQTVKGWEAFNRENMVSPKDAYISEYRDGKYEIVPDTRGSQLNIPQAVDKITEAVYAGETKVNLETEDCYLTAKVTADDEKLKEIYRTINKWVQTCVTYDWHGNEVVVGGDKIQEWIQFDTEPVLDEDAVAEFVSATAKELDTYGKKRKFKTVAGTTVSLKSGAYGWKTNRTDETEELIQLIYQGSIVEKEPVYTMKAANKGTDDIGSSYVEIDLSNQHLYLFKDGEIVLETDLVSGNAQTSLTPPGVFGITYKTKDATLRGETYESHVSYWMPFNGNIGMHDATWRRSFGGTIYQTNGSHGCINLPLKKAEQIYKYVSKGFPVICYY